MMNKIGKKLKNIIELLKNFGLTFAFYDILENIIFHKNNKFGHWIHKHKYENIKRYLVNKYSYIINNYKNMKKYEDLNISTNAPIFVFWWQGRNNMPLLVKKCIESIKKNSGNHQVNLITEENLCDYVEIPDYIMEKVNNGIITLTHFSDILRMTLLYKYGGIWLDATIYLTKCIPDRITNYSLYTIKHNLYSEWHVCKGIWSGNVFMSSKNNLTIKFFRDMFYEYWKNENYLIGYFLIDCIVAIGYENIDFIKKQIDKVPPNNEETFEMKRRLSLPASCNMDYFSKSNTYIFKLSYKEHYKDYINGEETVYKKLFL